MTDYASQAELSQLLLLMREYTEKLKEVCDVYATAKYRRLQIMLASVTLAVAMGIALWVAPVLLYIDVRQTYNQALVAIIGSFAGLIFAGFSLFAPTSRRSVYDAHNLAAIVERLIKTASQYNEHAASRISNRFEFDLRLAEADAAVRVYQDVFHAKRGLRALLP